MSALTLLKDAFKAYSSDRSVIYAAGLAYYAIFAIAPLLVLVVMIASLMIGRSLDGSQVIARLQTLVGPELAGLLGELAEITRQRTFTTGGTLLSLLGLLLGATGIFTQLDTALNDIWGISTRRPQSLGQRLLLFRYKMAPFIIVCFLGFLLGSSVLLDTVLGSVASRVATVLPRLAGLLPQINRLVIPILTFTTISVIYKWLPDARSRWRDIAVGALLTTVLFLIGRYLLVLYLARTDRVTLFGTAGSVVMLLIWVYVSAQILLFGAEFTKLYADRYGQPIQPRKLARFEDAAESLAAATPDPSAADGGTSGKQESD